MPTSRARRRRGAGERGAPKSQKVTARFSDREYEALSRLSEQRGERLSSLVRRLVVGAVDEVRARLGE